MTQWKKFVTEKRRCLRLNLFWSYMLFALKTSVVFGTIPDVADFRHIMPVTLFTSTVC